MQAGRFLLERPKTALVELQPVDLARGPAANALPWPMQGFRDVWAETSISPTSGEPRQEVWSAFPAGTSILTEIQWLLSWLVAHRVLLQDPDRIIDYLLQFPELLEVIPIAVQATLEHLPEAQLTLSLYRDPEAEDRYLTLYARLKRYDESLVERIEKAEARFLDLLADREGWLQLTTDFREAEGEDVL